MIILSIDTSCDETSAAVTDKTKVISNIIWSQASQHADFGGVMPSLAQRLHKERIDWVVDRALSTVRCSLSTDIDAIAVTVGPGLAIALEIGISKAKELAQKYNDILPALKSGVSLQRRMTYQRSIHLRSKLRSVLECCYKPIIPVNHIEAHLLSPLASPSTDHRPPTTFPALGLVVSGGNTQLILIEKIGKYKILAQTVDDALGEALDKAARLLGLGYPGGAILEKIARVGNPDAYTLPSPLIDDKIKNRFSYSGLKTAMYRLIEKEKPLTKEKIYNLAASFQEVAFDHILNVLSYQINHQPLAISHFLLGGGVASNNLLRSKLRKLLRPYEITLHVPYTKKLCGDNAAMIGVCAYLKSRNAKNLNAKLKSIDREPRMKIA